MFFYVLKMLLTNFVELLAEHFNISIDAIVNILKDNKIRIEQRLLLEKEDVIVPKKVSNVKKTDIVKKTKESNLERDIIVINNDNINDNIETSQIQTNNILPNNSDNKPIIEVKQSRGRGRPRKNTVMKQEEEEESEYVEVEEIMYLGAKYYLTSEEVVLSKSLEIEGIMRDGKIVRI
jgi:hypothetical protein